MHKKNILETNVSETSRVASALVRSFSVLFKSLLICGRMCGSCNFFESTTSKLRHQNAFESVESVLDLIGLDWIRIIRIKKIF